MRPTRSRTLAATAAAVLLLAACGDDDPATDDGTTEADGVDDGQATDPPEPPEPEPTPDQPPEVELLAEGEDPEPLRFTYEEGATFTGTFSFTFTQTQLTLDGEEGPAQPAIPIEVDASVEVTEVDDGVATISFSYADPRVGDGIELDEEELQIFEQQLAPLGDLVGTYEVDDRGIVSGAQIDADPATGLDQVGDEFASLSVPLPDEPVGVGGSWRVTQATEVSGIPTEQIVTVELVERDGDELTLELTIEGSSPPGPVDLPEAPGTEVELISSTMTGSGTSTLDLTRAMPTRAESVVDAVQELQVSEGDQSATLEQAFTIEALFEFS